MQEDLNILVIVANSWNLSLNTSKCVILKFFSNFSGFYIMGNEFKYKFGNFVLEVVKCHRELGVEVDRDLKFNCHYNAAGLSRNLLRSNVNRFPKLEITLLYTFCYTYSGLLLNSLKCWLC